MKTFFFFIALTFTSLAFSQGNLQFNQVLTFTGSFNDYGCNTSEILGVIPSGKVWKIEYIGGKRSSSGYEDGLIVNGAAIIINVNSTSRTFPIWIKAGDQIAFYSCGQNATGTNSSSKTYTSYLISIIEFNIIP